MDTQHHAFVDFDVRIDEQTAAILQVEQGITQRLAGDHGDQYTVVTGDHIALLNRTIVVEDRGHDAGTGGHGHELAAETDQATRRHHEGQAYTALAVHFHVGHVGAALAQLFDDRTLVLFFHVDHDDFVRLLDLAIHFLLDNFRTGNTQLEAFTAHGFDQYRQVQFTTAGDAEFFRSITGLDTQCHVVDQLTFQTLLDVAAGDELAFLTGEGRVVDLEGHGHGRLVHGQGRQCLDHIRITQGIGDVQLVQTGDADDVAGFGSIHFDTIQTVVTHDFQYTTAAHLGVAVDDLDLSVGLDAATGYATHTDNAGVAVVVQCRDLHLEGTFGVHVRRINMLDDRFEQRRHVVGHLFRIVTGDAVQRRGVDDREVQLLIGGTQVVEQVEHLIHDPVRTCAGAVDLVDHHDRTQAAGKRLLSYKAGLRHGAVLSVDQQQYTVNHG